MVHYIYICTPSNVSNIWYTWWYSCIYSSNNMYWFLDRLFAIAKGVLSIVRMSRVVDCCSDCGNSGERAHQSAALYSGHSVRSDNSALSRTGREPEAAWSPRHAVCGLCVTGNGSHSPRHAWHVPENGYPSPPSGECISSIYHREVVSAN
jgi:hypothetical protein